jgi:putative (di)nucleoside polyphosphate hydrolase
MTMIDPETLPYRPCAGIMIVNAAGQVFVGRRIDQKVEAWQLPQGGIDDGEDAAAAALRELTEETGIVAELVELIAEAPDELQYDLPAELVGKVWKGRYRGQRMRWFLFRFTGSDDDVDLATHHQEFSAWRWASPDELIDLAVPFKRDLYREVVSAFADHLVLN